MKKKSESVIFFVVVFVCWILNDFLVVLCLKMGGGNHNDDESSDKGLFSHLAGYATGQYPPSYGAYPPQGYPPQAYPPAGYPSAGGYPPAGYPFQGGYPPAGYPGPSAYPPPGGYPPAIYPGPSAPPVSGHGPNMGALIAGGAAAAAAAYGAHKLSHGAHNLTHGGYYGHHHGKTRGRERGGGIMVGQSRKWMILVASTWIQAFTGTNFDFSSYSSDLKSVLRISQLQLNYLSVASDMGKAFGWCSGVSLLYFPLWVVLFIAAFIGLIGYGLQWLVIQRLITLPYFLVSSLSLSLSLLNLHFIGDA
ncbi:hypothetical protein HYC85_016769 [Camellia sinensis]|uniref:Nodulin-like domain-containing protein n=1 Tax=Camellia sinensis TaxID=4442 RepID=A0A7J7H2S2_CAMSI|nr:hypothetical protein HYC85_016769 [Camellia sinensis]